MEIVGKTILITGANRGIGQALVHEALDCGVEKVYAGVRAEWKHPDGRVQSVRLDVTDEAQVQRAAAQLDHLDILVNNAGIAMYDDLAKFELIERHLAVNLFGPLRVTRAFLPLLKESKGAVVNNLSTSAFAPLPIIPAYSISKAAALSMTQSVRALMASEGVRVYAILTGPVDTDMTRSVDFPKASPESVAQAIFRSLANDEEDIFPDPMSQALAEGWRNGPAKLLERQQAAILPTRVGL